MSKVKVTKKELWKAISQFCLGCVGYQRKERILCTAPKCALFRYRLGKFSGESVISEETYLQDMRNRRRSPSNDKDNPGQGSED